MAWKPWYERMADMDTAEERDEFLRGVFGPPPMTAKRAAGMAMTALLAGWSVRQFTKRDK